jgi:hypothetical protein
MLGSVEWKLQSFMAQAADLGRRSQHFWIIDLATSCLAGHLLTSLRRPPKRAQKSWLRGMRTIKQLPPILQQRHYERRKGNRQPLHQPNQMPQPPAGLSNEPVQADLKLQQKHLAAQLHR